MIKYVGRNLEEWRKHRTFASEMNEGTEKFPHAFIRILVK